MSSSPMPPMAGRWPSRPRTWATRSSQAKGTGIPRTDLYDPKTGREIRRFEGKRDGELPGILAGRTRCSRGPSSIDGKPVITFWEVASGRVIRRIGSLPNSTTAAAGVLARRQSLVLLRLLVREIRVDV